MFFITYHSVNLIILAVAVVVSGIAVSKLRSTSATYNARFLRFAYFSLSSWVLWSLQYLTLLASQYASLPTDLLLNTGLALGVMHNALWASAVLSLFSKQSSRDRLTLALLLTLSSVIVLFTLQGSVLSHHLFAQVDAVSAATIFTAFAVMSINEWHLSKIAGAVFVIHGFSQWIWRSLWFTPLANTHIAVLFGFPLWRIALLFAWFRLMSAILERAQSSYEQIIQDIARLRDPGVTRLVMISSTVEDLAEERDAAVRAISVLARAGFRAETFASLPDTLPLVSASWAQRCDIFIIITGNHYGQIIEAGISVVEFEYNIAYEANPEKILVYVKDRVERESRLTEFLRRLHSHHASSLSLFTTPEELYEQIHQDFGRWLTSPGLASPVAQEISRNTRGLTGPFSA